MFIQNLIDNYKHRDVNAIAIEYGPLRKSYHQLEQEITALTLSLSTRVSKGDIVATYMHVCPELIVSMLAIMRIGAIFLPIDSHGHIKENQQKLAVSSPVAVVTLSMLVPQVKSLLTQTTTEKSHNIDVGDAISMVMLNDITVVNSQDRVINIGEEKIDSLTSKKHQPWQADLPDDVGYLYFTSGSTGQPKGVLGRLNSLQAFIEWESDFTGVTNSDRVSLLTPQTFDPFLRDVFLPLSNGATLCIPPQQLSVSDSQMICDWLNKSNITISHVVPSVFELLLDTFFAQNTSMSYTPNTLLFAGEPLKPALIKKLRQHSSLQKCRLFNLYGTTESTLAKCAHLVTDNNTSHSSFPVGFPMPGIEIVFRNADGDISRRFTEGEICFVGKLFSHGYFLDKNLTIEKISSEVLVDKEKAYVCATGDLGQLDSSGLLYVNGRKDNQVKVNGKRVELAEIESVLEKVEYIAKAVVIDNPKVTDTQLIACVISSCNEEWDLDRLIDYLHEEMDSHKVPQQIISLDAFPLNTHGKIDRKRLAMLVNEQCMVARFERNNTKNKVMVPPQTHTEKWLAVRYQEQLKCGNVSRFDSFSRLGGRSLQALRMVFDINQEFGCHITMAEFMRADKLSDVANVIDHHCHQKSESLEGCLSLDEKLLISHQRRLCFFQQRFPHSVAYNMTYRLTWNGALDKLKLQSALTALINNHPELRTRFYFDADGRFNRDFMQQTSSDFASVDKSIIQYYDISMAEDITANEIRIVEEQAQSVLSIDSGEPFCFSLIKCQKQTYILVMTLHHIVADEWSIEQLFSEWIERYIQAVGDKPFNHELLEHQNVNNIQQCFDESDITLNIPQASKAYWFKQLEGVPPLTVLPADAKSKSESCKKSGMAQFSLSAELTGQCQLAAEKLNVSLFSFFLSAFYLLLHKYSAQTDLTIGTPITGRTNADALGFYVNMLCYRKQVNVEQSVADFVFEVQQLHEKNLCYSEMPFDYLVEQICSDRANHISPLFQHSFSFGESLKRLPQINGIDIGHPEYVNNAECKFDFSLQLLFEDKHINGRVEYDCSAYNKSNIQGFLQTLEHLLEQMVLKPQCALDQLSLLPTVQHQTILNWNNTQSNFTDNLNVAELIESKLSQFNSMIALHSQQSQLTYAQLITSINQLANYLNSQGYVKGDRIAVSVAPSCELVIAMLAIMKAGAIYVPVDPSYPLVRRNYMLKDSDVQLVLTDNYSEKLYNAGHIISVNIQQLDLSAYSDKALSHISGPDDVAYIIYTSGSTGDPKGVEVFHKGICNLAEAEVELLQVAPHSRVLQFAAFSFDTSIWEMIVTLVAGATLVVSDKQSMMPGKNLATLCKQFAITHLTLPASALAVMPEGSLGSVNVLIVAGEACNEELMKKWSCDRVFINSYGPTEATVSVSNAILNQKNKQVHIGKPLANTQCWVVDKKQNLLPIGAIGELCISGVGLAKGYLNKPDITQKQFVLPVDPLINATRLYRTGDMVRYLSDGNLEYLGRIDEQVKLRGFRIELAEIENCLCQHAEINNAVVMASQQGQHNEITLIGYVATDNQNEAFSETVRIFLSNVLPVHAIPQHIVPLPTFPKLPNNKIDKLMLAKLLPIDTLVNKKPSVSPQFSGAEKDLADIWLSLLSLQDITLDTSFFEIGGHSLLAVKVVSMMRKKGWELDVNTFFESARLASLASQCTRIVADKKISNSLTDLPQINELIPLTHFQQGLWFESIKGAANTYNVCKVFSFHKRFEQAPMVQALNLVFRANDIFSIQFAHKEGIAQQFRSATSHRTNLAYLRNSVTESFIKDFAHQLAATPIKLGRQSPIESALFRDANEQLYLVINMHHILIDDASMQELLQLIMSVHDAFQLGEDLDMSECKSFLSYARDYSQPSEKRLAIQQEFWMKKLSNASFDHILPYSEITEGQKDNMALIGETIELHLPIDINMKINQLSVQHSTTVMIVWLTLFVDFLQNTSQKFDICLGIPVSNRPIEYAEMAIGLYLNTLVFRHQSSLEETFTEKLNQIKHDWQESYAYCDTPLTKVLEWVKHEDNTNFSLFNIMFVYQHEEKNEQVEQVIINNDTAKFPLTFFVKNKRDGIMLSVEFTTSLFNTNDVQQMINGFSESVLSHCDNITLDTFMSANETIQTNKQLTQVDIQPCENSNTAIAQFEYQARTTPHIIAVKTTDISLSYAELNDLANQCAENLANLVPEQWKRVGILLPRSEKMIAVLLGCLKLGITYVPMDINTPLQRLLYITKDAKLDALVIADNSDIQLEHVKKHFDSSFINTRVVDVNLLTQKTQFNRSVQKNDAQRSVVSSSISVKINDASNDSKRYSNNITNESSAYDLSTLAYIIYTSGSTGNPKGVMVDHGGLHYYLSYASQGYVNKNGGSTTFHLSFAFDASITSIFVPLINGGCVDIISQGNEIEQLVTLLNRGTCVDFIKLTPAHVDLLAHGLDKPNSSFDGTLVIGGEALVRNTLVNIKAKLPKARLINEYGPTEAIVGCCVYEVLDVFDKSQEEIPIGRPIQGIDLAILDELGHPVKQGEVGQLYICGQHLARGYLNQDELTASQFTLCAVRGLNFPGRSYASGDLVCELADGNLVFKGRVDDQIKHKGYRIELSEIEIVIRQQLSIAECAVIYIKPSSEQGRLLAFATTNEYNSHVSEQYIIEHCSNYLPEYMLPESVILIDSMPLTANGKIDRTALASLHTKANKTDENAVIALEVLTELENMLHEVWCQLLHVDVINVDKSFFALGGDSVFCLKVVFKLRKLGFNVNVETLLTHRTIAQLASFLEQQTPVQQEDIVSESLKPYEGALPLTPIQHWLFSHEGKGHEWFNQAYLYRLHRQVDTHSLESAILRTLNRHAAMRQSFVKAAQGEYQTRIAVGISTFDFKVVQANGDNEQAENDWIKTYVDNLDMSFDLSQAPLFKAWVFETQYNTHFKVLFIAHHAVVDAISWSVLVDEISHNYAHPNIDSMHKRFDNSLVNYTKRVEEKELEPNEVDIWTTREAQSCEAISLDYPHGLQSNIYRNCRHYSQRLSKERSRLLVQLNSSKTGISLQELLLTALIKSIAKWAHTNTIKIDVESHGRLDDSDYDMATMVGWLTAIFPVCFANIIQSQPLELIQQAAQQLREVPHKGRGYGKWKLPATNQLTSETDICFNFLGKSFERNFEDEDVIQAMEPEFSVQRHASDLKRKYVIEFDAWIEQETCQISWTYSKALHKKDSIIRLTDFFEQCVDELLNVVNSATKRLVVPADLPDSLSMNYQEIMAVQQFYPNVEQILPATPAQQGMAFHSLYHTGGPVYHEQVLYRISVPVELEQFYQVWQVLLSRHGMLRAAIVTDRFPSPLVIINQFTESLVGYSDLSTLTSHMQADWIQQAMDVDLARPFILEQSPLIRASLFVTGETSSQLLISHHHAILDGWSLTAIIDELNDLLSSSTGCKLSAENAVSDLIGLKNFYNYVNQHSAPDREFWGGILHQNMVSDSLPFIKNVGKAREESQMARSAVHQRIQISASDMEVVNHYTSTQNITLNTLIQGAWALVLHYFLRGSDAVFGVTLSGRTADVKDVETLVGLCINTLPMRVSIESNSLCTDWLLNIQQMMYSIQNHSQTSLPELSQLFQSESQDTFFDSIVVLTNYQHTIDAKKAPVITYKDSRETTNFPLTLVISESEQGLNCRLSGLPERLNSLWLGTILRVFSNMLLGLVENQSLTISAVMQKVNNKEYDNLSYIAGPTITLIGETPSTKLAQFAKKIPQQIAVKDSNGELSYRQLEELVNRLSYRIVELLYATNVVIHQHVSSTESPVEFKEKQPVIGVCCQRNRALLAGVMSCIKLKAIFLLLDPELPIQRLTYMVENAEVDLLLTDDIERFLGTSLEGMAVNVTSDSLSDNTASVCQKTLDAYLLNAYEHEMAYIMFTSGSTGKPKGVEVSITSFLNYLEYAINTYSCGQAMSSCVHSSIGFDGTITSLFLPLMTGGMVKMIPQENTLGELAAEIQGASENLLLKITPSHLSLLAEQLNGAPVEYIKAVIIGGEALDYHHLSAFKHCAPNALFVNEYGPTEATVGCCVHIFDPFESNKGPVPIGSPIQNTKLMICADNMALLPNGAIGELCIGGKGVARGYINLKDTINEKFVRCLSPEEKNQQVYRTGDRVYCEPDGKLHYLGRRDDQVKLNGVRIELGEIEEVIRQHIQMDNIAVVVSASQPNQLVAFVVGKEQETLEYLRQKLQLFLPTNMIPSFFVYLDSFPLTINGKIDRLLLMHTELNANTYSSRYTNSFVAPETDVQQQLCAIFGEVLKQDQVGIHDDFFILGGHSLTAMQLISRIAQRLGLSISLKRLFSCSTVCLLAQFIEQQIQQQSADVDSSKTAHAVTSIPSIKRASRRIH